MGTLYYGGSAEPIEMNDRTLAHLKIVISSKLRRSESFTVSWDHPSGNALARTSLWMHPSIPLRFSFDDVSSLQLDREWLESLATAAHSASGVVLDPETIRVPTSELASPVN